MARRVFFSFDYDRDIWRVGQVRNCWVTKPDRESAGYYDAATWESVKKQGDEAIKKWINSQLENTTVTVVLIGFQTSKSDWVKYEIRQSYKKENGILGIYIHKIKDKYQDIDYKGENPFDGFAVNGTPLSQMYPTYDWVDDDGYNNFADWVEKAAKKAGK